MTADERLSVSGPTTPYRQARIRAREAQAMVFNLNDDVRRALSAGDLEHAWSQARHLCAVAAALRTALFDMSRSLGAGGLAPTTHGKTRLPTDV